MNEVTTLTVERLASIGRLEFHRLANIFPLIDEGDEFESLKASIKAHGIQTPIVMFEGKILDGRNRYLAARAVGHQFQPQNFITFARDLATAKDWVISANVQRRHLTSAQRAELIKHMLVEFPNKTDREIAAMLGVAHMTVWKYRKGDGVDTVYNDFVDKWKKLSAEQRRRFSAELRDLEQRISCTSKATPGSN
jgi:ParB-like chromosome segregation protein Spo0J